MKFTIARKSGGVLTKTIRLGADGNIVSDGSACRMNEGEGRIVNVSTLADAAKVVETLSPNEALILGTFEEKHLVGGSVRIVAQRHLASSPGAIARSQRFFVFREGDGLLPIDIDIKDMPAEMRGQIAVVFGDPLAAILFQFPALEKAGRIERASTSSGLYNAETGVQYPGSGGKHGYLHVLDATDIPRAVGVLADRMVLAGYGWTTIGAKGQVLQRGLVDASVGAPERFLFEADPLVQAPLAQDKSARKARVIEGEAIDTRAILLDLTPAENVRLESIRAAQRRAIEPEAAKVRERADTADAKEVSARTGEPFASVIERIRRRHDGRLSEDISLAFDDPNLAERTVMDVLLDPVGFDGETLADPMEGIEYGRCKARVILSSDGGVIINSFAHGGALYRLCAGRETLTKLIETTPAARVVDALASMLVDALVSAAQKAEIMRLAAQKAGIGMRTLGRALKDAQEARHRHRRRFAEAQRSFDDQRPAIEAPGSEDELESYARKIDAVLAAQEGVHRPLRNSRGVLCALWRDGVLRDAHTLGGGRDSAPPPEPVLSERIGVAAQILVENFVRLTRRNDEGESRTVRLPIDYAAALNALDRSEIPVADTISALPIVRDGRLVSGREYDPEMRTLFCVPEEIEKALPKQGECSQKAAREAYRFVTDEWFGDVAADGDGKAALTALALTLVQRAQLNERPAFFITAGMAGGGKTTACNMVAAAVLGRRAAAMPLAGNEEELRKTLFAVALEGAALVVFDNVKSGARVSSPTLEAALTSGIVRDRILGKSEAPTARCSTVFAMTGNNVEPCGDMASRSLIVRIEVDRADPENREFTHPDPIGWSIENRLEILRALYTILLAYRAKKGAQESSRFKSWMRLVGAPIEAVSGVDFGKMFVDTRAKDPTAEGAAYLFTRLHAAFGDQQFEAAAVAAMLEPVLEFGKSYEKKKAEAEALREAIEAASDRNFPPGHISTKALGLRLLALDGRVVEADGWRFKLRCERRHAGNRYLIERREVAIERPLTLKKAS